MRLIYRFESENPPVVRLRLKIETNTREHLAVRGTTKRPFAVESRWWRGRADITTYEIEELLATKLRALFQRRKGRDLFDLWTALEEGIDPSTVVDIFVVYVKQGGHQITRALFEENLADKIHVPAFTDDIPPLLPPGVIFDDRQGHRARPGGDDCTRTRRAVEGKSEVTDPCHEETNRQTSVSKTSPKPGRIPGNSRGVERTQLAAEGVIAEPLTDESRAPSDCWKSGPNESPLRHQGKQSFLVCRSQSLQLEYEPQSVLDRREVIVRNHPEALCEVGAEYFLNIVDIGNGGLWETGGSPVQPYISWQALQMETTGKGHNEKRTYSRVPNSIGLNNQSRTTFVNPYPPYLPTPR